MHKIIKENTQQSLKDPKGHFTTLVTKCLYESLNAPQNTWMKKYSAILKKKILNLFLKL